MLTTTPLPDSTERRPQPWRAVMTALTVGGLLALASLVTGCTQTPACAELGSCGGPPPVGAWALAPGHGSCSEDLYIAPPDTRLVKADQPVARTPPPENALYDWCDLLVTSGGLGIQSRPARFSYESGPIGAAWLRYDQNGNYDVGLIRTGTYSIDFPALCMREFGAMDNRPINAPKDPTTPHNATVCQQLEAQIVSTSSHRNTLCRANPQDPAGCLCQFDVSDLSGGSGTYRGLNSTTLMHLLNSVYPQKVDPMTGAWLTVAGADFPENATYCNKGSTLQLTGANGEYLFNQPGLRTMDLVPTTINCTDGMKGPTEDGIDCGPACPNSCPNCKDGVKGPGEEGIDCGTICGVVCPPPPAPAQ